MRHLFEKRSEQVSTIRPADQPSRLSRLEVVPRGGSETLADQIAAFEGALTAGQLAKLLSISAVSLYKMAKSGRIPSLRIGVSVRFCPPRWRVGCGRVAARNKDGWSHCFPHHSFTCSAPSCRSRRQRSRLRVLATSSLSHEIRRR